MTRKVTGNGMAEVRACCPGPGRELDALVSEAVMGERVEWRRLPGARAGAREEPCLAGVDPPEPIPAYSTDEAAAAMVVAQASLNGFELVLTWEEKEAIEALSGLGAPIPIAGATRAHGLCLAALEAMRRCCRPEL